MNITKFLQDNRGLLIAPAGHGKTYSIAQFISQCPENERQLILTHTHAGINSIRNKITEQNVPTSQYKIETISGFAQRYVIAFSKKEIIPSQDSNDYFDIIIKEAYKLLQNNLMKQIISISYQGLFVDEYQDCSIQQHSFIMLLSSMLPTHILGDPLQGIFNFKNTKLVDMSKDLAAFTSYNFLTIPWRWQVNNNCEALGNKILEYRKILESTNKTINLCVDENAHIFIRPIIDNYGQNYYKTIRKIAKHFADQSILIIVPSYYDSRHMLKGTINNRSQIKSRFDYENQFTLMEAIDEKSLYSCATKIDNLIFDLKNQTKHINQIIQIQQVLESLSFKKTDLKQWFNDKAIKKRQHQNKELAIKLKKICDSFIGNPTYKEFDEIICFFYKDNKYKTKRPELFSSIVSCLKNSIIDDITLYQSMVNQRNVIRRAGRKINKKCIGTTLLTKGLEFETVIILGAQNFKDSHNFYVAISRACKNLIIFTDNNTLHFPN